MLFKRSECAKTNKKTNGGCVVCGYLAKESNDALRYQKEAKHPVN